MWWQRIEWFLLGWHASCCTAEEEYFSGGEGRWGWLGEEQR